MNAIARFHFVDHICELKHRRFAGALRYTLGVLVSRDDFEARLAATLRTSHPVGGPFLDSMLWTVGAESGLILAGARAALMQLAHPFIAEAVAEHSVLRADVQARFQRTLSLVYRLTFAPTAEVERAARGLFALHGRITGVVTDRAGRYEVGHRYAANTDAALFWVAATLWDTSVLFYERCVRPLSLAEKDAYYSATRRFCGLFGIPEAVMPADWTAFQAYVAAQLRTLAVGETARTVATLVLSPQRPAAAPLYRWARIFTAGLLPPRLRAAFALPYGPREEAAFEASLVLLRGGLRLLPADLRYAPAWHRCQQRLGRRSASPLAPLVKKGALWLTARA